MASLPTSSTQLEPNIIKYPQANAMDGLRTSDEIESKTAVSWKMLDAHTDNTEMFVIDH